MEGAEQEGSPPSWEEEYRDLPQQRTCWVRQKMDEETEALDLGEAES